MNKTTDSFFIGDAPKGSSAALPGKAGGRAFRGILKHIAAANESLERATARLIRCAELAYDARRFDELKATSDALAAIPYAPAQRAGKYYQAVILKRAGQLDSAAELLATVNAPRALLTLGAIHRDKGDHAEAARLHVEAMRASRDRDPFTFANAAIQLATARAIEGDHAGSLHDFQSIGPLIRAVAQSHPALYAIWHNSLAVELCELGYRDEARAAIAVAVASPIAHAYPEFEATADELREPERIAVAVAEPQREGKRRKVIFTAPVITHHSSLIRDQWSGISGRRSSFIIDHRHQTRAASRASPRAAVRLLRLTRK